MNHLFNLTAFKTFLRLTLILLLLFYAPASFAGDTASGSHNARVDSLSQRQVQNLYAFAKVYGYVKYFYPLKKKEHIKWSNVAAHGVKQVIYAESDDDLRKRLISVFQPIAPLLVILSGSGTASAAKSDSRSVASAKQEIARRYYYNLHQGLGQDKEDLPLLTRKVSGALYRSMVVDVDKQGYLDLVAKGTILPVDSVYSAQLTEDLNCSFPLVVTEAKFESNKAYKHYSKRYKLNTDLHEDRVATMVIFWNVFQHFYPYLDHADDWDKVFFRTMRQLTPSMSEDDFAKVGGAFTASLKDGHASFSYRNGTGIYKRATTPVIQTAWLENKLVVSKVNISNSKIKQGDIIELIDSKDAVDLLQQLKERLSVANERNADLVAGERILNWMGINSSTLNLTLTDSTGKQKTVQIGGQAYKANEPARMSAIRELEAGIYYIDASRISGKGIEDNLQALKQAKGIVFDLRVRPSGSFLTDVLPYLIEEEVETGNWAVPHFTFPDQKRVNFKQVSKYHIKPNGNYLRASKAFLIGHNTFSYGETCAELIDYYALGTTVGTCTAGTNGNINFSGAGNLQMVWTGMRVLNRDGSPFHGVGIEPDIMAKPIIQDIRANRDAQVEAAVKSLQELQPAATDAIK